MFREAENINQDSPFFPGGDGFGICCNTRSCFLFNTTDRLSSPLDPMTACQFKSRL
jgi:hypothetical protein